MISFGITQRGFNVYENSKNYNILSTKLYFFHKNFKKQEKNAGTDFLLLSRSRYMMGQFMKAYLHKPIKSLQFLTRWRIQKI